MEPKALIELLRKHPKACATFHLKIVDSMSPDSWFVVQADEGAGCLPRKILDTAFERKYVDDFRHWLTGKCLEWCDVREIEVTQEPDCAGKFIRRTSQFGYDLYDSRLHAMLDAMQRWGG